MDRNIVFLASMVLVSIVGRKYLDLDLDDNLTKRPLFQLMVIFAIVYINTRAFVPSLLAALAIHFLSKTEMFKNHHSDSDDKEGFEEPQYAQRPRGPKRCC